jgi:hypothetical protein
MEVDAITANDQINEKNVALIVKGGKLTAKLLAKAINAFLNRGRKTGKGLNATAGASGTGKQTVDDLIKQGAGVSSIEITDKNIKQFERTARKYGVDFALKKDKTESPPKWIVFFKGKDADALTAAFKEFTAKQLKKTAEKPSVISALRNLIGKVSAQDRERSKQKERGIEL